MNAQDVLRDVHNPDSHALQADVTSIRAGVNSIGFATVHVGGQPIEVGMGAYNSLATVYQPLILDPSTRILPVMDYEHHKIHTGDHYFIAGVQDLAINEVLDLTWMMPDTTKWMHWAWELGVETESAWYLYEGVTATNALANTITPLNSNRNSLATSAVIAKYEVQADLATANADTTVAAATLIESGIAGAGKNPGTYEANHEVILKQNTLYCLRVVATTAGYTNFKMNWYEHTNLA